MSDADIDLLIFLAVIGAAAVICGTLLWAIYRLIDKIQNLHEARRCRETVAAVKLYYAVKDRVPGEMTPTEYDRAVQYTIRKYHMADRHGGLDMRRQDPEYIAKLIAAAVGQDRLSRWSLAVVKEDRGAAQDHLKEGGKTA